jgi:hypothetical protein
MNRMSKIALGLSLAIAMASGMTMDTAQAAKRGGAQHREQREMVDARPLAATKQQPVTFFVADPELGVAGMYQVDGKTVYFEARRAEDPATGALGDLGLRFVDAEGRTLALGGTAPDKRWVPKASQFTSADAGADAQLLSGLSKALQSANLHAALSAEKSALADLALQTAGTPAKSLPLRVAVNPRKSAAADVGQLASFYESSARGLQVKRGRGGALQASLGNGIVLESTQKFVMEPDENGRMGRIDAYSVVKSSDGYVLSAEFGGDNVPNGWDTAVQKVSSRSHVSLATDFGRAATALQALAYSGKLTKGVSLSNDNEQDAMRRHARSLTSDLLPQRVEASAAGTEFSTKGAGGYSSTIQVWRKPFVVIAEHSGTRIYKYSYSSSLVRSSLGYVNYCNHGTCPGGTNMTWKCTYSGPRLSYLRMPSTNTDAGRHTCDTPYWAVARTGHHNCHDDSSTQVRAIRGLSYSVTGGRCGSFGFSAYAPACDGS